MSEWTSGIPLTFALALAVTAPAALPMAGQGDLLKPGSLKGVLSEEGIAGVGSIESLSKPAEQFTQWFNGGSSSQKKCSTQSWRNC